VLLRNISLQARLFELPARLRFSTHAATKHAKMLVAKKTICTIANGKVQSRGEDVER